MSPTLMPPMLASRPHMSDSAAPEIRLVPAPRSEPPTDEQLTAAGIEAPPMWAPLLPLDLPGSEAPRNRPRRPPSKTPPSKTPPSKTPPPTTSLAVPPPLDTAQRQARRAVEPATIEPSPALIATRRFLTTCLEVIGGFRPLSQLRPFCLPDRYSEIAARLAERPASTRAGRSRGLAHLAAAARTPLVRRATSAPPRAGRAHQTGPGDRVTARHVQMCEATDGVAEVAVVLTRRDEVWAMALRFECHLGRWLCTDLQVL
jgi:hypothetical protein